MENYREKFKRHIENSNYYKLDNNLKKFIEEKAYKYMFSYSDIKQLVDISIDLKMWDEKDIKEIWIDEQSRKNTLLHVKKYYEGLKTKPKKYTKFKTTPKDNKFSFTAYKKDELSLGMCPVASPKTRCCNLMTLDAVESCGFDCSYCSIQSFYNEGKIGFDINFADKLKKLKLDPNKTYHIGTGQSSDSLMWGNKHGILKALFDFAKANSNVILELKTKSDNISYLLENEVPKNILCTWSINTTTIIENEEHLSAPLKSRIDCARKLADKGVLVGFHFHPIVVYDNYLNEYKEVVKILLENFDPNEVALVSLGTLTFIKPVIKKLRERDFKSKILQMPMIDASGKKSYPLSLKEEMFKGVYEAFKPWHNKVYFYMCMEDESLWKKVFGYEYSHNDNMENHMVDSYMKKIKSLKFRPDPSLKKALVSGSSSGIGMAISNQLRQNGYEVYGISRRNGEIICDLRDTKDLYAKVNKFLENTQIDLLVNCAGLGVFEPHEEISLAQIEELIDVNLKAPIVLTNLCLRSLKKTKGHIINIASIEATKHSKFSALYTATKSGLRDFSLALFEELRKSGVKVTNINPDMTKTAFFDNLKFKPSSKPDTHILADDIAHAVINIIQSSFVTTDITIRAQKFEVVKK